MSYYNPYLVVPFMAWLSAQSIKFFRNSLKGNVNFRYFYASGDMPSAHTAAVGALTITALMHAGFTSPIFGISGLFAAVVIYDSFGVRRASGDQAVVINTILRNLSKSEQDLSAIKVRQVLGHKPIEVIAGAFLGVAVALIMSGLH